MWITIQRAAVYIPLGIYGKAALFNIVLVLLIILKEHSEGWRICEFPSLGLLLLHCSLKALCTVTKH